MNDISKGDSTESNNPLEILPPIQPKNKVQSIFESLEVMALQRGKGGVDIGSFNSEQKDKLLDIMGKNEENAFAYHTKKLEVSKEVALAHITSTTVVQRTKRYIGIGILTLTSVITVLILLLKSEFFIHWLTFITGLAGGFGIGKISKDEISEVPKIQMSEDDEND
jgi:hypothetical protein